MARVGGKLPHLRARCHPIIPAVERLLRPESLPSDEEPAAHLRTKAWVFSGKVLQSAQRPPAAVRLCYSVGVTDCVGSKESFIRSGEPPLGGRVLTWCG